MISIHAFFTPFRLNIKWQKKVDLYIEMTNKTSEDKLIGFSFICHKNLNFGLTNINQKIVEKNSILKAGEKRKWYLDVSARNVVKACALPIDIKVEEFYRNQNYPIKTYDKQLILSIDTQ